jgi:hypothetical protein
MDLKFETKEIFSKDDFVIEIKNNQWRKLIIEGEEENDLSNGIYIYSKKLKEIKEEKPEEVAKYIQCLFDFTLKIKQKFDKFQ